MSGISWDDSSEIVFGQLIKHKISKNAVRPELFVAPYNSGVKAIQSNPRISHEELIAKIGLSSYDNALEAEKHLNGTGDLNWVSILEKSKLKSECGASLKQIARKLQHGDDVDLTRVTDLLARVQAGEEIELFTALSDIDREQVPFIKTGWKALDKELMGIPSVGMILMVGAKKSGKTSAVLKLAGKFVQEHKDKTVAFFSMEMLKGFLSTRMDQIITLSEDEQERVLIRDSMETPEEVMNRCATISDLGLVIIDFADLMIQGETNESSMGHIYRTITKAAKNLRLPIILLAHPNRQYQGGILLPEQVRYTGLATILSEMIITIWNPEQDTSYNFDPKSRKGIPFRPGYSYIVCWEVRSGFRNHEEDSPGAIQIKFMGRRGWANSGKWFHIRN